MAGRAQSDTNAPTRRALLAGVLGGVGAWVAGAIGRASHVEAANGDPVLVGQSHTGTSSTTIFSTGSPAAITGHISSTTGTSAGVSGHSSSSSGRGVLGAANLTVGRNYGVWGQTSSPDGVAVVGWNPSLNAGVVGISGFTGPSSVPQARRTGVFGYADGNTGSTGRGVWGRSSEGRGVMGTTDTGYAGYFQGRVFMDSYVELAEIGNASAPGSNRARLFVRDNGSGKTQLCVRFHTGAVRTLATEP